MSEPIATDLRSQEAVGDVGEHVSNLRKIAELGGFKHPGHMHQTVNAADFIEAQARRIAELEREVVRHKDAIPVMQQAANNLLREAAEQRDALVAENEVLRSAGQKLFDACANASDPSWPFPREMQDWKMASESTPNERASRMLAVVDAARCIRHWHDAHDGGMIVSGEHVRKLWETISTLDGDKPTTPPNIPAHKGTEN